jgi:hypothetical protein
MDFVIVQCKLLARSKTHLAFGAAESMLGIHVIISSKVDGDLKILQLIQNLTVVHANLVGDLFLSQVLAHSSLDLHFPPWTCSKATPSFNPLFPARGGCKLNGAKTAQPSQVLRNFIEPSLHRGKLSKKKRLVGCNALTGNMAQEIEAMLGKHHTKWWQLSLLKKITITNLCIIPETNTTNTSVMVDDKGFQLAK